MRGNHEDLPDSRIQPFTNLSLNAGRGIVGRNYFHYEIRDYGQEPRVIRGGSEPIGRDIRNVWSADGIGIPMKQEASFGSESFPELMLLDKVTNPPQ